MQLHCVTQENSSHCSSGSVEIFGDVTRKTHRVQRRAPAASAVDVVDKKKSRRQAQARKVRPEPAQQTHKFPSFSEFDDYHLIVNNLDSLNTADRAGEKSVRGDLSEIRHDKKTAQNDSTQNPVEPKILFADFDEDGSKTASDAFQISCAEWNDDIPQDDNEVLEQQNSEVCHGSIPVSIREGSVAFGMHTVCLARLTSTPALLSSTKISGTAFEESVDCPSQIPLFDASSDAGIGTYL